MTNKELFFFIGKCLSLDDHPDFRDEIIRKISNESIDWQRFVYHCSNHLILPVIYLKFRSHEILKHIPEELSDLLKEIYELNSIRNNLILKQLQDLTNIFNKQDIYPTFMKGTGNLLDNLYSDRGERIIGDIDLLVPEKEYQKAAKVLKDDGYVIHSKGYTDIGDLKHYPGLFKAGTPARVEIHRLPVEAKYFSWFNPEMIEHEKKVIKGEFTFFLLSDSHKAIHNFIHGQLGHEGYAYGIASFRDIYDLYLIAKRIDLQQTFDQSPFKRKGTAYLALAGKAFDLPGWSHDRSVSTRLYLRKHDLNLTSTLFFVTHRSLRYLFKRIVIGYTSQLFRSVYSKRMRQLILVRITNRNWCQEHLNSYKVFFHRTN